MNPIEIIGWVTVVLCVLWVLAVYVLAVPIDAVQRAWRNHRRDVWRARIDHGRLNGLRYRIGLRLLRPYLVCRLEAAKRHTDHRPPDAQHELLDVLELRVPLDRGRRD